MAFILLKKYFSCFLQMNPCEKVPCLFSNYYIMTKPSCINECGIEFARTDRFEAVKVPSSKVLAHFYPFYYSVLVMFV